MSALELAPETSLASGRATLSTRVIVAVANLYRAWQNRRAFLRVAEMTEAELKDIGLTRADIHEVVTSPFGADPTTRLRLLVETRTAD